MKKYSIFHAPYMSFYSGDFYRDVGLNWSGSGFGYLFLLLFVCVVPQAVKVQLSLLDFAAHSAPALVSQVPEIKILNGEATVLAEQPLTINNPETGKPLIIVNTTDAAVTMEGSEAFLLLKKSELLVKISALDTRTLSFKEIRNLTINQAGVTSALNAVCRYGGLVFLVFAFIGAFIFRVVQLLIYGALGLAIASLCGANLTYGALVRLSVMAVTPVIIVSTAAELTGIQIPYAWLLGFGAAMGLLFLGVKSVSGRQEPAAPVRDDMPPAGPQGA